MTKPISRPSAGKLAAISATAPVRGRVAVTKPTAGQQVDSLVGVALWQQLQAVAGVMGAIAQGQSWTSAIKSVAPSLKPGVQALGFAALRNWGRAKALRTLLVQRTPAPVVDALLCTTLALSWNEASCPYAPYTLVDQAVEAAKRQRSTQHQAAFVNACLRRFLRERNDLVANTEALPEARWNHPDWWIKQLRHDHPEHWQHILLTNNAPAPFVFRISDENVAFVHDLRHLFATNSVVNRVGPQAYAVTPPVAVDLLAGFAGGQISVQDAGAQLAAPLLLADFDRQAPLRILDACAAPGGKTAHLCELAPNAFITALDIDASRCERIEENLKRVKRQAHVVVADAAKPATWWNGELFDAILLDAPCTASGIVRRHPDVRWLRRPSDIAQLAAVQRSLLDGLWPLLRPGGRMVYCTCSVFRAEGQLQVQSFVARNTDVVHMPSPGHMLPKTVQPGEVFQDNPPCDHDGFFYALLHKQPN